MPDQSGVIHSSPEDEVRSGGRGGRLAFLLGDAPSGHRLPPVHLDDAAL